VASLTPIGLRPEDFALQDLRGNTWRLSDLLGRIGILVFWSCECPHVERLDHSLLHQSPAWPDDVAIWRIASAANESVADLERRSADLGVAPVLLDPEQGVADAFGVRFTPHVFVLDRNQAIRYAGAPDDVSLRQRQPTRHYLAEAVACVLRGEAPSPAETPAFGCALTRRLQPGAVMKVD